MNDERERTFVTDVRNRIIADCAAKLPRKGRAVLYALTVDWRTMEGGAIAVRYRSDSLRDSSSA